MLEPSIEDQHVREAVALEGLGPFGHAESCVTRLLVDGISCDCEVGSRLRALYGVLGGEDVPELRTARRITWEGSGGRFD